MVMKALWKHQELRDGGIGGRGKKKGKRKAALAIPVPLYIPIPLYPERGREQRRGMWLGEEWSVRGTVYQEGAGADCPLGRPL